MRSKINLKEAIRNLNALPTMPVIAQKILALNLESNEGEIAMLKLIEKDPLIAAKIIGLANTPFFSYSKKVSTLVEAAMLLGTTRVKSVTLSLVIMTSMAKNRSGKLDFQGLWLHSFCIAIAMRTLSRAMPMDARPFLDEIFFAGLLHDIGYMVLNHLDQESSDELHTRFAAGSGRSSIEIEAEFLEMNHCELGAELARYWSLPDTIIAVIRYHHEAKDEAAIKGQPLVRMLNLAEKILPALGMAEYVPTEITAEDWIELGIDPEQASTLIEQIRLQAEEAKLTAGALGG
jgi:putative nucleotidyltransferase with HDIG domain